MAKQVELVGLVGNTTFYRSKLGYLVGEKHQ